MLNIDTDTYLIELTRGDTATITFSATDADGNVYLPVEGDVLTFAVAKKVGAEPIFSVVNPFGTFNEASPTQTEFEEDPSSYFTLSGTTYTRCTELSVYDANETYYTSDFWDIHITTEKTKEMAFKDYVYDVQIESSGNVETIIGKTDDITPKFRVWGEVADETE